MEFISTHITYNEAVRTRTGLANKPAPQELAAMKLVASKVFEPLRQFLREPVQITSFFRCEAVNTAVKGSKTSSHKKGEAMDITSYANSGYTNADMFYYIKNNLEYDQLIWEFGTETNPAWVHVSYKAAQNRKQILKAVKQSGKTKYSQWNGHQ